MSAKDKKRILQAIAVCLVLLLAFLGVQLYNGYAHKKEAGYVMGKDYLFSVEDIVDISYYNGTEEIHLVKGESGWIADGAAKTINQSTADAMARVIKKLGYQHTFFTEEDPVLFGFDDDCMYVTFTDNTGCSYSFRIGNEFDEGYYLMLDGDERIFTIEKTLVTYLVQ